MEEDRFVGSVLVATQCHPLQDTLPTLDGHRWTLGRHVSIPPVVDGRGLAVVSVGGGYCADYEYIVCSPQKSSRYSLVRGSYFFLTDK